VSSNSRFVAANKHTIIRKIWRHVVLIRLILLTTHFDGDGEALKQFVATHADNVNTDDALFWPNHHHLEQRWFLVLRGDHGEVKCAE
jgi:hypothetical protein